MTGWLITHPAAAPLAAVTALLLIALAVHLIDRHRKDHP